MTHDPFEAMFISNKIYIINSSGKIVQSGSPNELYNNPINSYVAGFFGETNIFHSKVINGKAITPIGTISAPSQLEQKNVVIHVRPQGIKLSKESTPVNGVKGTVMASKMMGSFSFVHLSVLNSNNEIIHVHSHMPSNFIPSQSSAVGIEIDKEETYIFPS